MRTTLDIDAEILSAAREFANARDISLGKAVSELARRGLHMLEDAGGAGGFPVFDVPANARRLTVEDVKRDKDEA